MRRPVTPALVVSACAALLAACGPAAGPPPGAPSAPSAAPVTTAADPTPATAAPSAVPSAAAVTAPPARVRPTATMAAPRPRGLSTAAACRRVAAAGGPFFDVLFDEGTARPEGEPLPREYLDRVHRVAPRFVRTLRATAADARDTRVRRALNAYAAKVQRHVVDSPDLAGLTPENSGWLLDLGELCGDSLD